MTQDEIALKLKVSRARVSFLERQAIRKMKRVIAEHPQDFPYLLTFFEDVIHQPPTRVT